MESRLTSSGDRSVLTDDAYDVFHSAIDSLPGGAPAMLVVSEGRVDCILSRAASVDEIVAALPPMVKAMNCGGVALRSVA